MMRRLYSALAGLLLLAQGALAAVPTFPTYWYALPADNAGFAWEYSSGGFVSYTSANYNQWLTDIVANPGSGGDGYAFAVTGAVDNGSGACRLTVANLPSSWLTGQRKTVTGIGGATGCNVNAAIIVISATQIDLQGTTFGGAYTSGGVIGAAPASTTSAEIYAGLNVSNLQYVIGNTAGYACDLVTSAVNLTLTNPFNRCKVINNNGAGDINLTLPVANVPYSIPVGYTLLVQNQFASLHNVLVKGSAGTTLANLRPGDSIKLYMYSNAFAEGSWAPDLGFTGEAAINCVWMPAFTGVVANGGGGTCATTLTPPMGIGLIGKVTGVNFNAGTTDTAMPLSLPSGYTRWTPNRIQVGNCSAAANTATVGLFSTTGGGGTAIASDQAVTVTTASANTNNNAQGLALGITSTELVNFTSLQVRVGTPQGSAVTCDVHLYAYLFN